MIPGGRRWWLALPTLFVWCGVAPAESLPTGFEGIQAGSAWPEVEARFAVEPLDDLSTSWSRHVRECGYRTVRIRTEQGELLATVHDQVVTALALVTPIRPESHVVDVADLVVRTYGQPAQAEMRNRRGEVTLGSGEAHHVALRYEATHPVEFTVSGAGLWQYRIQVRYEHHRWHENKNLRCARERERK